MLDDLIRVSLSDAPERAARMIFETMQHLGTDLGSPPIGDLAHDMRSTSSEVYADLTDHTQQLEKLRAGMIANCSGPLGMRAVRDNVEYTVKVCTSPQAPDGTIIEPTNVTRREIE